MSEMLPLFPLGTVLFPGMVLPLHIFEERYRRMIGDLLARPEPREFGIIAIQQGREVGASNIRQLYEVGCIAQAEGVRPLPDGRFELAATGTDRFRLLRVDDTLPYYQAEIERLPDVPAAGGELASRVQAVRTAFRDYLDALADHAGAIIRVAEIPEDPALLSCVVAAGMVIDLPERQSLLEAPDPAARLAAERSILIREVAMLRTTTSRPAPDLSRERFSPN